MRGIDTPESRAAQPLRERLVCRREVLLFADRLLHDTFHCRSARGDPLHGGRVRSDAQFSARCAKASHQVT